MILILKDSQSNGVVVVLESTRDRTNIQWRTRLLSSRRATCPWMEPRAP